jgi:hypothetical protein
VFRRFEIQYPTVLNLTPLKFSVPTNILRNQKVLQITFFDKRGDEKRQNRGQILKMNEFLGTVGVLITSHHKKLASEILPPT